MAQSKKGTDRFSIPSLDAIDFTNAADIKNWRGSYAHTGSEYLSSPHNFGSYAAGKTTMGTVTLMAGVLRWAAQRIHPLLDASHCEELAVALFAWQFDWESFDEKAKPHFSPPEQPAAPSALFYIDNTVRDAITEEGSWYSFYQPIRPLFRIINVTYYILPAAEKKTFLAWLTVVSHRINSVAKLPAYDSVPSFYDFADREEYRKHCAPYRGVPLPPEILNPDISLDQIDIQQAAIAFVQSLNPKTNRFLKKKPTLS